MYRLDRGRRCIAHRTAFAMAFAKCLLHINWYGGASFITQRHYYYYYYYCRCLYCEMNEHFGAISSTGKFRACSLWFIEIMFRVYCTWDAWTTRLTNCWLFVVDTYKRTHTHTYTDRSPFKCFVGNYFLVPPVHVYHCRCESERVRDCWRTGLAYRRGSWRWQHAKCTCAHYM